MEKSHCLQNSDPLRIAVLGDLHGHFSLAFGLLRRFEVETGQSIDLILQVGDFGAWPDPYFRLDPATKRFAFDKGDIEEISFPYYLTNSSKVRILDQENPNALRAPIIWVKGNHEDVEYLKVIERFGFSPIPVDYHGRMQYLPNGKIFEFDAKDKNIKIGSLGGLEQYCHGLEFKRCEIKELSSKEFDILLTHQPYQGGLNESGSDMIRKLAEFKQPSIIFCGHYHIIGQELEPIGQTRGYILNEVNFRRRRELNKNCIRLLELNSS